ncbi:MAG: PPOX class F420-dependent oxidoreductase [Armatimonadota bacterium]|nr:PPOX class F420-dependent oxidoreductase [Armatimonadota bacterium]MDR7450888.1 PPOX class F420-dependent oxidoreductase [Armatimonadota bacterium]MDR7465810.1 PPOX class F420-dependent oxidoreductase [Armatimonadota bacterium]MDR7493718.1 PPOX class F420-dependent oxidoreductase [Armatimonadota bacterium]MDR7498324.1 PPOX class F420-dependent oxidoreductase [Armatimonadota bacterium]
MALPDAVREFLQKPNLAVLATVSPDGRPQATPVWFLVEDDGHIMINTARGRVKLRNVEVNPHVALAVYDRDDPYRYVQIRGRVVKIDPARGAADIDRLSLRYRGRPYQYPPSSGPADRVTLLIRPRTVHTTGFR